MSNLKNVQIEDLTLLWIGDVLLAIRILFLHTLCPQLRKKVPKPKLTNLLYN